jgi:hypothetical protein
VSQLDKVFEQRYQNWKAFINAGTLSLSSSSDDYINNIQFQSIVDLGSPAVPFIIHKLKTDDNAHFLVHALEKITKHRFTDDEIAAARKRYGIAFGNQQLAEMWMNWWESRS